MIHKLAGIALTALALGACAHTRADPFVSGSAGGSGVTIEVRNLAFADATLHARRGGQRIRLGVVTGKTDETFRLDWTVSHPLQVEIDLLAGPRCLTRPLQVDPGDVVELQIDADMERDPSCTHFDPAPGGGGG